MHINLISTSSSLLILLFHSYLLLHHYCTSHLRQTSKKMTIKQWETERDTQFERKKLETSAIQKGTCGTEANTGFISLNHSLLTFSRQAEPSLAVGGVKTFKEWMRVNYCSGAAQHATQEEPDKTPPSDRQEGCSPQGWWTSCINCPATRQQSRLSQRSKHTGIPHHNRILFMSIYGTRTCVWYVYLSIITD